MMQLFLRALQYLRTISSDLSDLRSQNEQLVERVNVLEASMASISVPTEEELAQADDMLRNLGV